MSTESATDIEIVEEQLHVYGLMRFPKEFMNISQKAFWWVYDNRKEWVEFSEKWKEATGLFKFWYLYVKLRASIRLKSHDQSPDRSTNENQREPVYTVPLADE